MQTINPLVTNAKLLAPVQNMRQKFEIYIDGYWVDLTGREAAPLPIPDPVNALLVVQNASLSHWASNVALEYLIDEYTKYWVSPTGAASWAAAQSETPLSGAACCSLATANANAAAGDIAYLRGGTYVTNICPVNSGTSGARIIYRAYGSEVPLFTVPGSGDRWAIKLQGVSYVKVDGIDSYQSGCFFRIGYGSCYNEILNCNFDQSAFDYSLGLITWTSSAGAEGLGSDHNWIHHNTFSKYGEITTCNDIGTVRISANGDDPTCHNTFEDNVFYHGGHDCIDIGGEANVARRNVFHNEETYYQDLWHTCENDPASGYFGNRNILLSNSGDNAGTAYHTLIEGNRIGWAGTPPDDDGSSGIENAGAHTLVRGNYIYGNFGMGYYSKMQPGGVYPSSKDSGSFARVYQNTIYKNGGTGGVKYEPSLSFTTAVTIWSYSWVSDWPRDIVIKNNIVFDNYAEFEVGTANILPQITYDHNYNTDPHFVNPDMSDKASLVLPNLMLDVSSPCINGGENITLANGAGNASTALTVDDAYSFQDGTWGSDLSDMRADWIAIGTVGNIVEIASIDYATKVITLASPMTWADNAPIWLYSDSSGVRVLYGTAPNYGADQVTK
jgi:hypothetical protein